MMTKPGPNPETGLKITSGSDQTEPQTEPQRRAARSGQPRPELNLTRRALLVQVT
jgi:hypothetical protein